MKQRPKHCTVWLVCPYEPSSPSANLDGTFHQRTRLLLTVLRMFALMPLDGISALRAVSLKYSYLSLCNFRSLLAFGACFAHAVLIFCFNITSGFTIDKFLPLIWFAANAFMMLQFMRLARKWPKLMQHWEAFEHTVTQRDAAVHAHMRRVTLALSIPIPVLAAVEHALSLAKDVSFAEQCKNNTDTLTAYFLIAFPAYFHFVKVNLVHGVALQVINFCATFAWSMTDAFILLVSLGLITQFRHFNKHIERFRYTHIPPDAWQKHRVYFTKLTELLDHVNEDLAALILASFVVNTFYICVQLFETISPRASVIQSVYFWFSFTYMIGKTFLVSIVASVINDESKKPVKVLESVPSTSFGSEATRLLQQVTHGTIALGGMKFFYLTRTFLISMIGTIVSYELILMQLQSRQREDSNPCEG